MNKEELKFGFIGCGNMGKACVAGMISSKVCSPEQILVSSKTRKTCEAMATAYGVRTAESNAEVAKEADVLFLAVKPYLYEPVISEIRECLKPDQLIISIAPGKTLEWLQEQLGGPAKVIHTMPNTPALVGEGMMGVCASKLVTDEEMKLFRHLCEGFTRTEIVAEHLMDVVTAVSGSSPAYVFMFIEAMADAAVVGGMPRKQAYEFADSKGAQALSSYPRAHCSNKWGSRSRKDRFCKGS